VAALLPAARLPFGTHSQRRHLHAPSFANGRGADPLPSPGSSRSIARKITPKEELAQLGSARTESGLELFLAEIGRHRLLSAAEEVALAKRVERGDLAAKKQMINANLRLVVSIAKR
jgi:DNA-directed RNA polymerase sigma subunit (sigma70/sigma32)